MQKLVFTIPAAARNTANDCLLFTSTGDALRAGGAAMQCVPVGGFYSAPSFAGIAYTPADEYWTSIIITHENCITPGLTAIDYAGSNPAGVKLTPATLQAGGLCDGPTEADILKNYLDGFSVAFIPFVGIALLFVFFRNWNKLLRN